MPQPGKQPRARGLRASSPGRLWLATAIAVGVLALAGVGHRVLLAKIDRALGEVVRPARPLGDIPLVIDTWRGQEFPLDVEALGVAAFDDDHLNRVYVCDEKRISIQTFIGYVGRPRTHFGHRPDVCYAAHGFEQRKSETLTLKTAAGDALTCALYTFEHPTKLGPPLLVLATYMVNGRYWEDPDELTSWTTRNPGLLGERPAYLTRIQLSVPAVGQRELSLVALSDLMEALATEVERCMPYWEESP